MGKIRNILRASIFIEKKNIKKIEGERQSKLGRVVMT